MAAHLAALVLLLSACGPRVDRASLQRRPLTVKNESGWARLRLEPATLAAEGEPWIGDEEGRPVPFLRERPGLWGARQLDVEKLLLGADAEGRATAEFSLRIPPTLAIRDREHLRIDLDLHEKLPWIARVELARRLEGAAFLGLPRESPLHLQNLDGQRAVTGFLVPWDAREYRVVLHPIAGSAPTIRSLRVSAVTEPAAMEPDKVLVPAELQCEIAAPAPERWRIRLASAERAVGLEIQLKAPAPPVRPVVLAPGTEGGAAPRSLSGLDLAWNLPQRGRPGTRIAVEPSLTDRLVLALPAGARLESAKVLARSEDLLLPVQAGRHYWLHLGGLAKPAGEPGPLPPSRLIYGRDPIRLGPAEPDPQGIPRPLPPASRAWMRWAALGGAALLAAVVGALLGRSREG